MTTPTLRERLKRVQMFTHTAQEIAILPASARALIAETTLLLADLVAEVERLSANDEMLRGCNMRTEKRLEQLERDTE